MDEDIMGSNINYRSLLMRSRPIIRRYNKEETEFWQPTQGSQTCLVHMIHTQVQVAKVGEKRGIYE